MASTALIGLAIAAALGAAVLFLRPLATAPVAAAPVASAPAPLNVQPPVPDAVREGVDNPVAGMFGIWVRINQRVTLPGNAHVSQYQQQIANQSVECCTIAGFTRSDAAGVLMGMQTGDAILTYDGVPVHSIHDICDLHGQHHAGDVVTVEVLRQGQVLSIHGPLGKVPLIGGLGP